MLLLFAYFWCLLLLLPPTLLPPAPYFSCTMYILRAMAMAAATKAADGFRRPQYIHVTCMSTMPGESAGCMRRIVRDRGPLLLFVVTLDSVAAAKGDFASPGVVEFRASTDGC